MTVSSTSRLLQSLRRRRTPERKGKVCRLVERARSGPVSSCLGLCLFLTASGVFGQTTSPGSATIPGSIAGQPTAVTDAPATVSQANGAAPLTLSAALSQLRRENLALLAARQELDAARADVIAAGVLPNPHFMLGGLWVMHGVPSGGMQEYQIGAGQELPLAGQPRARRNAAQAAVTAAEHEYAALAWESVFKLRSAYLDLEAAQARLRLADAALQDLSRVEAVIDARARAGANPTYDQLRLTMERARRVATTVDATSALVHARSALAQAIGPRVDAQAITIETEPGEPQPARQHTKDLVQQALSRRPEVAAARLQVTAKEQKTRAIARQYIPSPELSLGYARWSNVSTDQGGRTGGALLAGLSVPIPIFDHGQGTIDRSRAETLAASTRRGMVEIAVQRQVEQAERELRIRLDAWYAFRARTPDQADRMRATAEIAYREGRATILELLDAYNTQLAMQELSLTLRTQALRAALTLEWTVGPGSSG